MKLSDFLQGAGRPIAYYPSMARMLGDVKEAVFLCQMAYWKDKGETPEGWIYKTAEEIEKEMGLSYKEQTGVRDGLKEKDLLEEYYARTEHKMYFRVNWDAVNEMWEHYAEQEQLTKGHMPKGKMPPEHPPKGGMPPSQTSSGSLPKGVSLNSNTEITPDTTQKNTCIEILEHFGYSVFGNNMTGWWNFKHRLEKDDVVITGDEKKIIISGLSKPYDKQFTEAEFYQARIAPSFATLGLEIQFSEFLA
jgi:hypothetical protein